MPGIMVISLQCLTSYDIEFGTDNCRKSQFDQQRIGFCRLLKASRREGDRESPYSASTQNVVVAVQRAHIFSKAKGKVLKNVCKGIGS